LPGERFVERNGVAVLAGWTWTPQVDVAVVREVLGLGVGDVALWWPDNACEIVRGEQLLAATRSAIRSSGETRSDVHIADTGVTDNDIADNDIAQNHVNYLAPPRESPWSWRDDGQSISWNDGPTIAFRPEIEAVLRRLAPNGLPPFGAVVWLLAACRDGDAGAQAAVAMCAQCEPFQALLGSDVVADIDVLAGLKRVADLPPELRDTLDAKATLAELVFDDSDLRTTHDVTRSILDGLSHGLSTHIVGMREAVGRTLHLMLSESAADWPESVWTR
jgi:hypothetical protein